MTDDPQTWVLLIVYFVGSMYFSASETAFMTANRFKIKAKAEEGSASAKLAAWVIHRLENSIIAIVIFNNLVNLLFTALLTVTLVSKHGNDSGELISSLISVPLLFIFAETIPKMLGKRYAEEFVVVSAYLLVPLIIISYPVTLIFRGIAWLVKKMFGATEDNIFTPADFEQVIETIEEHGIINEDASDIIISSLEFSETVVKDVITPKNEIVAYDISKFNKKSFKDFVLQIHFSRIPLYDKSIDKIVGVILVRDYIKHYQKRPSINPRTIMSKPYFVNYKITLTNMIEGFKKHNTHIAFVVDDKNKLLGMVTMEDVLEELVGQIAETNMSLKAGDAHE